MPERKYFTTDSNGLIIWKKPLWKSELSNGELAPGSVSPSALYDNRIVMTGYQENKETINLINVENGQKIWQVPCFRKYTCYIDCYYRNKNYIILQDGYESYKFDIENGNVLWNYRRNSYFWQRVSGIDSLFFVCSPSEKLNIPYNTDGWYKGPYNITSGWVGNTNTGNVEEFFFPDLGTIYPDSVPVNGVGGNDYLIPYKDNTGNILVVVFQTKYLKKRNESHISLYNFTQKSWIYQKIPYTQNESICGLPKIYNNRIYMAMGWGIGCFDLFTGTKIWYNYYGAGFSFNGLLIAEDKLFAAFEGYDKCLVAHDLETGSLKWKTPCGGGCSEVHYLNGVVYFVSAGESKLYAIDASMGKILWKIDSPDFSKNSGAGFKWECAVIPGKKGQKGKVIVTTPLNSYCYEAER